MNGYDMVLVGGGTMFAVVCWALFVAAGESWRARRMKARLDKVRELSAQEINQARWALSIADALETRRIERARRRAGGKQKRDEYGRFA